MNRKDKLTYYSDEKDMYIKIGWFSPTLTHSQSKATNFFWLRFIGGFVCKWIAQYKYETKFRVRHIANLSGNLDAGAFG